MLDLSDSDVHVWVARLGDVGLDDAAALALLSEDERDRLARFRSPLHGRRYALAHGFVRTLLASYLDADPRALTFERGQRGKPALAEDCALFFNLSHSGDVVAVAVTRVGEVGIDVEIAREVAGSSAIARALMPAIELASFEALHASARSRAFLEWWTRREAAAKATGEGIADLGRSDSAPELTVQQLEIADDCVAAVALASADGAMVHETSRQDHFRGRPFVEMTTKMRSSFMGVDAALSRNAPVNRVVSLVLSVAQRPVPLWAWNADGRFPGSGRLRGLC